MPVGLDPNLPDSYTESAAPSITANVNQQAGETNQQVDNSYLAPAQSAARGLLHAPSDISGGLSYGDKATTAAIQSRYQQQGVQQNNALKIDTMKNADADHIRNLQVATQAAGQEVEQNKQKAILKWKVDQANKKARGQILGTTLGIVGGVVGTVYGGPAGGAAGYQLGSGAGQAIGSNN